MSCQHRIEYVPSKKRPVREMEYVEDGGIGATLPTGILIHHDPDPVIEGCNCAELQRRIAELEKAYDTWNELHNENVGQIERLEQQLQAALEKAVEQLAAHAAHNEGDERDIGEYRYGQQIAFDIALDVVRDTLALLKENK